ncbi:Abi-domain-containing protein [Peniophora sp. CONT]|nr:Abi-domain-containing protein [Peniophora sp. CONT]
MPRSLSVEPPPELLLTEAHALNIAFTCFYVLPLILTKWTNPSLFRPDVLATGWRNDPAVIKARLLSVSIATVLSCCVMHTILNSGLPDGLTVYCPDYAQTQLRSTTLHLGLFMRTRDVLASLVTPVLYIGPLYAAYLAGDLPFQSNRSLGGQAYAQIEDWVGIRNHVVGPITEELVWRSCIIAGYRLAGASRNQIIFCTPLSFGAAHLHHGYESYIKLGRTRKALQAACLNTLFQFTYTTLFGFHCAFLFYRTGSVVPPLIAHVFCNIMGVPQLPYELRQFPRKAQQIKFFYVVGILGYAAAMRWWT